MAPVWSTGLRATASRVQIPPPPPIAARGLRWLCIPVSVWRTGPAGTTTTTFGRRTSMLTPSRVAEDAEFDAFGVAHDGPADVALNASDGGAAARRALYTRS